MVITTPIQHPSAARHLGLAVASRLRDERGVALVELALVLPIFLILVFGIIEFGLATNSANDETHLANEVARFAAVNYNPGGSQSLQAWVKSQADSNFLTNGGQVCVSFPSGTSNIGDPVQVTVSATFNWLPVLRLPMTSSGVSGQAVMRLEQAPSAYSAGCA